MKVLVLGAGAVGLCLAARLSRHAEVHAVCRQQHADAISTHGFRMTGIWGEGSYHFSASTEPPADVRFEYVILTAKSSATQKLCAAYRGHLNRSDVVSLQNGIGNEDIISEYTEHVIGGTIITGFEWRGDGQVEVTVEAGPIRLGRYPHGVDQQVVRLVELFREAGLQAEASDQIQSNLWAKTLYNCALNPLGAIVGVSYGRLSAAPAWAVIEQLIAEAFAVCKAEAVPLPWDSADRYLDYLQQVQLPATAGHHSSMLQDIRKGRETEIDFMNGAIARLGSRHGIPTPVNDTLVNLIRFKTGDGRNGA